MSIIFSAEDIEFYRGELADVPEALTALDILEDCEGDLEDAAIAIAIRAGQEPDISAGWIDGVAKRWRHILCHADVKDSLEDGISGDSLTLITANTNLPIRLATMVALYVVKTGVEPFCEPLSAKIG